MTFLDNTKMGPKLIGAFLLTALFAVFVGIFGTVNLRKADDADKMLYEKMTVPIGQMSDMQNAFQRARVNLRDGIMSGDMATYAKRVTDFEQEMDKTHVEFQKTIFTDEGREQDKKVTEAWQDYRAVEARVIGLFNSGKRADAENLLRGEGRAKSDVLNKALDDFMGMKLSRAKLASDTNTASANSTINTMIVVMILAALVGIGIGVVIARSIVGPLGKGVEMMKALAMGHVGMRLKMARTDEIGQLAQALDVYAEHQQVD